MKEKISQIVNYIKDTIEKKGLTIEWTLSKIVIVGSLLLTFLIFIHELGIVSYWNISLTAIDVSLNSIYELLFYGVIFVIFVFFISLQYKVISEFNKEQIFISIIKIAFISLFIFIFEYIYSLFLFINYKDSLILTLFFHLMCLIVAIAYRTSHKHKNQKSISESINETLSIIIFCFLFLTPIIYFNSYNNENNKSELKVVNNEYVIIYENSNQYYLAKYNSNSNKIDKTYQKIVSKENVEYKIVKIEK